VKRYEVLLVALLSCGVGVLVGLGLVRSAGATAASARGRAFDPSSPLSVPGLPGALPPLPPGVTVDANGIIQGLNMAAEPGTTMLTWETLRSFEYSAAVGLGDVPESLKAVDGTRVTMVGFLMPNYEWDDIHQFALVGSHWSCCFGMPAGLNGTVNVTLADGHKGLDNTMEPLRVVGTFRAREVRESGWLIAIYTLDDAKAEKLR
jgi:hypothetical protein